MATVNGICPVLPASMKKMKLISIYFEISGLFAKCVSFGARDCPLPI